MEENSLLTIHKGKKMISQSLKILRGHKIELLVSSHKMPYLHRRHLPV